MANNTFLPTGFTATSTFQQLSALLDAAGISSAANGFITSQDGYIKNNDTAIDLYIGQGTSAPSNWATIGPESAILFESGLNTSLIWIKCASSTVSVDFVEGANAYNPPLVNGVIGTLTATENVVPKADSSGNLVASTISDDGAGTVTIASDTSVTGTVTSDDATTPAFIVASGNTNTGYIDIFGKTSGKIRITTADATAQTINITAAGQTSGAGTITIPDLAGASTAPVFTGLTQSITGVKTMTNPVLTAPVVNGATTAAAANNFDFSTGTGTFLTSTGANTLSGAVTVNDATTPSITLASGKTNTGFLLVNGKTSGSTKLITADATAQAVVISTAAQTVGGCTLTIPNQTGNSTNFAFANQDLRAAVTADVTNATATMSNITDLSLTLLAGATYIGTAVFKCADSTAAEGISIDFDGSAATMTAFAAGAGVLTGGTTVAVTTVSSALATDLNWTTITGETWITVQLGFTVNAAGTFIPRFCQGTAHTSGTATVYRGSWLHLTRIG
jgi:hypothetical protein